MAKAPPAPTIHAGQPVYTLDNKKLGVVSETIDTHFKVHVRFRHDFWLARDQVAFIDEEIVGMLFRSDEQELYRLSNPRDSALQRSFERKVELPEQMKQAAWRDRFPL
jgi:hypothetical protein